MSKGKVAGPDRNSNLGLSCSLTTPALGPKTQ